MELMFINGIMNSPTFPPRDLWLSGYSISYYHFGYVMASMLALFTGVPATIAFNLMLALIFGLSAVVAYGILYNLLAHTQYPIKNSQSPNTHKSWTLSALFAPLFLLIISNVEGFLEVLHRKGFFWRFNADGTATSAFWTWLDMQELSQAPAQPLQWVPERFWWWWRASRVIQDYDLNGNWTIDTIDEFPFFSYLLGDMHPHVLAMPFALLAIAVALKNGPTRMNVCVTFVPSDVTPPKSHQQRVDQIVAHAEAFFRRELKRWGHEQVVRPAGEKGQRQGSPSVGRRQPGIEVHRPVCAAARVRQAAVPAGLVQESKLDQGILWHGAGLLCRNVRDGKRLVYLDSASSSQKPRAVIDAVGSGVSPGRTVKAVFSGVANPVITAAQIPNTEWIIPQQPSATTVVLSGDQFKGNQETLNSLRRLLPDCEVLILRG